MIFLHIGGATCTCSYDKFSQRREDKNCPIHNTYRQMEIERSLLNQAQMLEKKSKREALVGKTIIGLDPGIDTCGLAVYHFFSDKVELHLFSGQCFVIIKMIEKLNPIQAFIEDLDAVTNIHEYHFPPKASLPTKLMIAQKVGKAKGSQLILQQALDILQIETVLRQTKDRRRVPEHRKDTGAWLQALICPTKANAEQFAYLLEIWGVTIIGKPRAPYGCEHSRDAATLCQKLFI